MNDKIQGPPPTVSARRRLLRGAFGAPAVLTLYSGSVAATSLSLCVQKAAVVAPPVQTTSDAYLSVRMWQFRKHPGTLVADGDYFVRGVDLVQFKRSTTGDAYLLTGSFQRFTVSNNTAGVITMTDPVPPTGFVFELSSPAKYVALRVDARGTVIGVGKGTGTAVGATCWNSFAAFP